ncbi:MAG: zf-HC2 domain-containing protein [Clostridia bacterium]|nr:zf-HC2 domain-containing protein [Clostridia bacterium]
MKKNECNVVQDLIPLVIDRVASDESRELVETHISVCEDCRKKYEAMKADLPKAVRTEYEYEQQKFVDALMNVRKKRLRRRILSICLAAFICMAAAFAGIFAYDELFHQHTVPVNNSLYALSLSRLKNGSIVVSSDESRIHFDRTVHYKVVPEDGQNVYYVYCSAAPINANRDTGDQNSPTNVVRFVFSTDDNPSIHEIRQGTPENYVTVWTEGEPIADASEEVEFSFGDSDEQLMAWLDSLPTTDDGNKIIVSTTELREWLEKISSPN